MSQKKRIRRLAAALAAAAGAVIVASASAHTTAATHHHSPPDARPVDSRSLSNGPLQGGAVAHGSSRGATLTVKNNDVDAAQARPAHQAPPRRSSRPRMGRVGATARVHFTKAGVYKFKTKAGEDYSWASHMMTTGEDNVLRLTVTVR